MLKFQKNKQGRMGQEPAVSVGQSRALAQLQNNIRKKIALLVLLLLLVAVMVFAMSAAWYTNVVQTSGLLFTTEAWGFEGEISVNSDAVKAAPGDEGLIGLEVNNDGDDIVALSVNISKAEMPEQMQKRFFFYADTQQTRNGEIMERVYLNNRESYTYTLFPQNSLTLTQEKHNDVSLQWKWVYDVLGYYVVGQWQEISSSDSTVTGKMTISEYLRPIEYDFDAATTALEEDEDGNLVMVLKTVDGETGLEDFLVELSKTDGYEGVIDPSDRLDGYYPVDVDEDGYGVYAYLCNYAEIELATEYDTMLGQAAYDLEQGNESHLSAEELQYTAKLTMSANSHNSNVVAVNTQNALQEALNSGEADTVQLTGDIRLTESALTVSAGSNVMVDLNGYTMTTEGTEAAIKAEPGSELTLTNGVIKAGTEGEGSGVVAVGAQVVLHDISLEGYSYGINVRDSEENNTEKHNSNVRILESQISSTYCTVFISGNGSASSQLTQLIIEDSVLNSDTFVISGNGSEGRWGTDIQVLDSTLTSNPELEGAGIYLPQRNSVTTISGSTVSGYTGICLKGGMVKLVDSTIWGYGVGEAAAFQNSGFADTGDAVYIETNYEYEIRLEVSGNSVLNSRYGQSLQVYEKDAPGVTVRLYGGTYGQQQPETYLALGCIQKVIDGGYVIESQNTGDEE